MIDTYIWRLDRSIKKNIPNYIRKSESHWSFVHRKYNIDLSIERSSCLGHSERYINIDVNGKCCLTCSNWAPPISMIIKIDMKQKIFNIIDKACYKYEEVLKLEKLEQESIVRLLEIKDEDLEMSFIDIMDESDMFEISRDIYSVYANFDISNINDLEYFDRESDIYRKIKKSIDQVKSIYDVNFEWSNSKLTNGDIIVTSWSIQFFLNDDEI